MHVRELVELAALVSYHGPALVAGHGKLSPAGLEQYWTASRCRLERWSRGLKELTPTAAPLAMNGPGTRNACGLLEEVLASEVLTRVWTALLACYELHRSGEEASALARSILTAHLEARNRVLKLLVSGPELRVQEVLSLNRLRQRADRWTDLLVGHLSVHDDLSEFAQTPDRARDFADELRQPQSAVNGRPAWLLTLSSLRASFRTCFSADSPNPDSNAQIAAAVLSSFEPDVFDSTGLFPSLWMTRLASATVDAQVRISDLFADEARPTLSEPAFYVRTQRWPQADS